MNPIRMNGSMEKSGGNSLMKCVFCGGTLKHEMVTFTYDDDDQYILVEHVPAEVCSRCGEKLYTPEVTDALLAFAKHLTEPIKIRQVPVYDFATIPVSA
jgi:HTH-type transcriptional regulator/antitoxin MqsA